MSKKVKIGLIYSNNENWIGGTYYILNLIHALNKLNDSEKPELTIFCDTENEFNQIKQTNYPLLNWKKLQLKTLPLSLLKKLINKISYLLDKKQVFTTHYELENTSVEIIFPGIIGLKNVKNIFWIPDFQEQKLPQFFSKKEIENRNQSHYFMAKSSESIVFSSNNALEHFQELFPNSNCKKSVINFAVTHPDYKQIEIAELQKKYNINHAFFISPNQFWQHKNQLVILQAIKNIVEQGITNFLVVFTGKEIDTRNPAYFSSLQDFVTENKIENQVRFLGFIDRKDQLKLMSESIAVIQPSLFEGWSTVVEDAKAMNQFVIASDINVHKEQLNQNVHFFNPNNEVELSSIMLIGINKGFNKKTNNYENNIYNYATSFIKLTQ
ncbi:MAG: glycosyltransferase family 1 protein [Bacteroidota bacterium]